MQFNNIHMKYSLLLALLLGFVLVPYQAEAQTQNGFSVTQKVRNLTQQNLNWADSVEANPRDQIEFQITVTWGGPLFTTDVLVRETLAEHMVYAGNLKRDNAPATGDVAKESINLGTMGAKTSKVLTFEATVAAPESLDAGTSNLINTATVFNTDGGASTTSMVRVTKAGSPTDISTGALNIWMIGSLLMLALVFIGSYILLLRYYIINQVVRSTYETS
jgi:hypothetical protein